MLSLLTYKHGICLHLGSLVSFISILKFSAYKFCFIWFTHPYLIFWDIKNEIVFLISVYMCSLLVYRNTFFIGYPACWELNGIMSLFKEDFYLGFLGAESVQFRSVDQSCLTLCDPMVCSTPGLSVHHQLPEFTQTHVHRVQPSHLLSSPSSPTFNLSQHRGFFKWVSSLHHVIKVLEVQLQHQSFWWMFRTDILYDWLAGYPWHPRDSQESSPTPQFKSINSSALSFLHSPTLTSIYDYWKKP